MEKAVANYILQKMETDYDQIADDFSATRAFPWAEMKNLVAEYVQSGERILDAGCGNGRLYELVKDKPVFYEGIDGSSRLVALAKAKYGCHFSQKNLITRDSFPPNSFSLIFCIATFQHVPGAEYRQQVLQNFYNWLLPGSYFIMINWNILVQPKFQPYLQKAKKLLDGGLDDGDIMYPWRSQKPAVVYRYYHGFSETELNDLLTATGFKVVRQYYTRRGEEVDSQTGYNIVSIAYKK